MTSPIGNPPPGWYDSPTEPGWQRWWDGTRWTEHRQEKPPDRPNRVGDSFFSTKAFGRELNPILALVVVLVVGGGLLWFIGAVFSGPSPDDFRIDGLPPARRTVSTV